MTPQTAERTLTWLLWILGVMMLTALFAVVMPTDWMAATHAWLGLGTFPEAPITEYMARSLSMMYGLHGVRHRVSGCVYRGL